MKILVTGAAGFIGSSLCERLVEKHQVIFEVCHDKIPELAEILELIKNEIL